MIYFSIYRNKQMGYETDFIIQNGYFETFIWAWIGLGVVTFVYLFYQPAPYGRH